MALSYTQNLEDYHLWLALQGTQNGFYIDVGAGHPIADNVSFWFYERGWRGIVVEPQPRLAEMYAFVRPRDICVPTLVGKFEGETEFYQFDRLHGLSTMEPKFAEGGASEPCRRATLSILLAAHDTSQPLVEEQEWHRWLKSVESRELIMHDEVAALAGIADQPEPVVVPA